MQQEVVLAMLAKEPSQGFQLRARLDRALGPLGEAMNDGQIYVTLRRLEKAGLVAREALAGSSDRPDRPDRPPAGVLQPFPTAHGRPRTRERHSPLRWVLLVLMVLVLAVAAYVYIFGHTG